MSESCARDVARNRYSAPIREMEDGKDNIFPSASDEGMRGTCTVRAAITSPIHCVCRVARAPACQPSNANRQNRPRSVNRVATPNPQRPGNKTDLPSCANSHSTRLTAKHVAVTPGLPTAFTMAARRTSRAAAKRAQQALGTSFCRVLSLRSFQVALPLGVFLVVLVSLHRTTPGPFCNQLFRFVLVQRQSGQLRGSACSLHPFRATERATEPLRWSLHPAELHSHLR